MTTPVRTESRGIRLWIACLCGLVFAMVVVGGITRLTRSGLSIVEWRPVTGALPPIGEAEWQAQFDSYKQFPEYQQVNHQMSLDEFKGIFFWEYLHRLLGRVVGLVLLVPLVVLAVRRRLTKSLVKKLAVAFALGGLQGFVGWYMVKSGLVNVPRVSHYRLATHLSLAFFLFSFLFWIFLGLRPASGESSQPRTAEIRTLARFSIGITAVLALQIVYGAFVAGMRAGYGFNTFPLMNGQFVPDGIFVLTPAWLNLFENPATVQFIHRMIAYLLVLTVSAFWWRVRRSGASPGQKRGAALMAVAVLGQFALGVSTLLLAVPVSLAVMHQAGAFVLLAAAVYTNFNFRAPKPLAVQKTAVIAA